MPDVVSVTVTLSDGALDKLAVVRTALKKVGLRKMHVMKSIGIVAGEVEATSIERLRKVQGVQAVEREGEFKVDPPGSGPV